MTQVEETYGATTEDVVSVTATKTVSGYSYELIVKNTEESEPYQVTIFYDSTTEETTDMGSVDIPESTIPDTDAEESVTDCEPVPEEEWQTPEVSEVVNTVKEETQVTQITEIKVDKKPLVWTFQVTGEG